MGTKRIPFDILRVYEEGVKVVTREGLSARILCTDLLRRDKEIVAAITGKTIEKYEYINEYYVNGRYNQDEETTEDLMLEIPVKSRRMTNQELAWWLREHPEEHRELTFRTKDDKYEDNRLIYSGYDYSPAIQDKPVGSLLIRSNGGEWHEPLIEEVTI